MIAVIGLGFVGLTTALGLAAKTDHTVYAYEIDPEKRGRLQEGSVPFYEPYLQEQLHRSLGTKLIVVNTLQEAVERADLIFYCTGTPNNDKGETDLSQLLNAVSDTLAHIDGSSFKTLIVKSTVPPGTTGRWIAEMIERKGFTIGRQIGLANNPEFLREGCAWLDFVEPDRIVIGEGDTFSGQRLEQLYAGFHAPVYKVPLISAEFIKYMSNSLLATLISFANEMSMIAGAIKEIDVQQAFQILQTDKRWTGNPAGMASYVYPGCGYGGYCLPKDIDSLIHTAEGYGYAPTLLKEVVRVNAKVKSFIFEQVERKVGKECRLGILGLSFKPESDDVRNTASKCIIEQLLESGYTRIIAYDPKANRSFHEQFDLPIDYAERLEDLLEQTDAIVLLTAWEEFRSIEKKPIPHTIIDGRYFISADAKNREGK